jgi:hypothetical protein
MSANQKRRFTKQQMLMRRRAGLPEVQIARRQRRRAPLSGEVSAIVVGGLNYVEGAGAATRELKTPASLLDCFNRISRLIELLQHIDLLLQSSEKGARKKYERLLADLNKLAERYKWNPTYAVSETGLALSWQFPDPQSWEHTAVWWIRRVVEEHAISRLRRCHECHKWFYAAAGHQRFCEEECRKKFASRSPLFKEKRRRYMAEVYRPMEKKRDMAAMAAAKRSRK